MMFKSLEVIIAFLLLLAYSCAAAGSDQHTDGLSSSNSTRMQHSRDVPPYHHRRQNWIRHPRFHHSPDVFHRIRQDRVQLEETAVERSSIPIPVELAIEQQQQEAEKELANKQDKVVSQPELSQPDVSGQDEQKPNKLAGNEMEKIAPPTREDDASTEEDFPRQREWEENLFPRNRDVFRPHHPLMMNRHLKHKLLSPVDEGLVNFSAGASSPSNKFGRELALPPQTQPSILEFVNRPPEIMIRNTFRRHPRSSIDLRISIDEEGRLNVEAGPEAVQTANGTTSDSTQLAQDQQRPFVYLDKGWNSHRPGMASGRWPRNTHFHDKRRPFWMLKARGDDDDDAEEHRGYIGHGLLRHKFEQRQSESSPEQQQPAASITQLPKEESHSSNVGPAGLITQQESRLHDIMGPALPPVILERGMSAPSGSDDQHRSHSESIDLGGNVTKLGEHSGNTHLDEQQPQHGEEDQVKPVVNIDDFGSSGCPALNCGNTCPGDLNKLDLQSGCPTCDCCPNVTCRMACQKGYESDQHGCPICRCVV